MSVSCKKTDHDRARDAADVWAVLGLFVSNQREDDGLSWSAALVANETKIGGERAIKALDRLHKWNCLAVCVGGLYKLTQEGLEAYHGAFSAPALYDPREWVREALTGVDRHGGKSTIKDAVIPTRELRTPTREEHDVLAAHHVAKMVSEELGITYAEAVKGIKRGEFFRCEGFSPRGPHMAKKNNRHALCAACAKRRERGC